MRFSRFAAMGSAVVALAALSACGGGGHGFGVSANPVVISSNALPPTLSGQVVNHLIPFSGGSGGPYLLEKIAGDMPDGVGTDNQTVALVGLALEDGVFDFTLRLTDTGSSPFTTSIQSFHWVIGIGPLVFATDTVLPGTVFNAFASIQLVVAGGIPPYSCEVVDLPAVADEPLPTGMSIPPDSCSIVGAPQQAHPGAAPFIVSVRATDSTPGIPLTTTKTFQVPVLIPPIIITTLSVPDGKCGTTYDGQVDVADGVPPFLHSVVDATLDVGVVPYDAQTHRLRGEPGSPNGVAKGAFPSGYELDATAGPYTGKFPEGLFLRDATGTLLGKPRRTGAFNSWMYNVQSTLLPNESSQNKWKAFSFTMTDAVPPALAMDPLSMPAGQGFAAPNNKLPDLEVGITYSQTFNGLNGVPHDGKYDSPHESEATSKPGETSGKYEWGATTFQIAGRPANLGMQFTTGGLFSTTTPGGVTGSKGGFENINLVMQDLQLPAAAQHAVAGTVQFAIGPDTVVITESSLSTGSTFVDATYEVPDQTVEIFDAFTLTPTVRQLSAGDMAATHTNPTGLALSSALKNIDFLSVTVNPTWWAYDNYNLCALGARASQHADPERRYEAIDYNSDAFIKMQNGGMPAEGFENSSNNAIELPETTAVAHSPATGVYTNGGLLYAYDNPSQAEYGFFVVRKDSKIYVPFSIAKSGSATGFGDGWVTSTLTAKSMLRKPQITVSPDGRFAAAKIKADVNNFLELANASRIVLFSLTGEKVFGGQTWRIITTGASGTTNDGTYLYADSLTLTNRYLYYMTGNFAGQTTSNQFTTSQVIWREHWVWRYDLTRTSAPFAGALLAPAFNSNWPNTPIGPSGALSTTWHRWQTPGATGTFNSSTFEPSYTTNSSFSSPGTNVPAPDFFTDNMANFAENSMAPTPFRVSRNGKAIAIIAAPNTVAGGTSSSTNFQRYGIYVDWDAGAGLDNGVFRMASTLGTNRRFRGASRIGGLRKGDEHANGYRMMGWYDGPATQMEISDDGTKVAAVYNASTGTWFQNSGGSNAPGSREDLALYTAGSPGSSTDPWSSTSEDNTITNGVFTGSLIWRFGCLAFTRDGSAVVFWGGYGLSNPTTGNTTNSEIVQMSGSLYSFNVLTNTREGILNKVDGGHAQVTTGAKTYSTSIQNNQVATNWTGDQGSVGPIGAFYSNDGKFFWMESHGALTTSDTTPNRLVGVNVSGDPTVPANTINGKAPLRGFAPGWPSRRGFGPEGYYYYPNIRIRAGIGTSGGRIGQEISAAGHKGLVFFASYYAGNNTGTVDSATSSFQGGGPANSTSWPDYGAQSGEVFVMDSSVGGQPFQLTNLGGTTALRMITYLQSNRAGNRLAFVHNPSATNNCCAWTGYSHFTNTEQIVLITNITTNATTGALTASAVSVLEGSPGRAGASMSFDFTDSRLYYAFTTGGNENGQAILEKKFDPITGTVTGTRTQLGLSGTNNRFAILHSGR